jgi:Beta-lactamase enzyme family
MKQIPAILLMIVFTAADAQTKTDEFLKGLIWNQASPRLKNVLQHPDSFNYQLIYTRIDRDKKNRPTFKNYYYNVNCDVYFNPASTVKMPLAFLALEKLNRLKSYGINKYTAMLTDSSYSRPTPVLQDTSSSNKLPSVAQYIRKIFLVSDNDAYNRLYEFKVQQTINERLREMGYKDIRITRRFVPMSEEENRHTNAVRFVEKEKLLLCQAPAVNTQSFDFSKKILIGKANYDFNDSLISLPMDFTRHNNIPLEDLQNILQSVLFPESVPQKQRFRLSAQDYSFLYQYMSEYPSESKFPHYDTTEYFNSYTSFSCLRRQNTYSLIYSDI